jgi:citronellol/citronellal dehydrogenase
MERELDGLVAIVTGASRGVGAATAIALAAEGVAVACVARATDASPVPLPGTVDETVRTIERAGGRAVAVPANLAVEDDVVGMVRATTDSLGPVDLLVNNAAITFAGDLDLSIKRHDLIFAVNVRAPLLVAQAVVPGMRTRGGGAILNVSSIAALNYFPTMMAYGMSKIALEHFTVSLAAQLRADRIAVNTFRIDVPVASEGYVANTPGVDHSNWEPTSVAAEGIVWMLRQPSEYTGRNESMIRLHEERGIMAFQYAHPDRPAGVVHENPMQLPDSPEEYARTVLQQ